MSLPSRWKKKKLAFSYKSPAKVPIFCPSPSSALPLAASGSPLPVPRELPNDSPKPLSFTVPEPEDSDFAFSTTTISSHISLRSKSSRRKQKDLHDIDLALALSVSLLQDSNIDPRSYQLSPTPSRLVPVPERFTKRASKHLNHGLVLKDTCVVDAAVAAEVLFERQALLFGDTGPETACRGIAVEENSECRSLWSLASVGTGFKVPNSSCLKTGLVDGNLIEFNAGDKLDDMNERLDCVSANETFLENLNCGSQEIQTADDGKVKAINEINEKYNEMIKSRQELLELEINRLNQEFQTWLDQTNTTRDAELSLLNFSDTFPNQLFKSSLDESDKFTQLIVTQPHQVEQIDLCTPPPRTPTSPVPQSVSSVRTISPPVTPLTLPVISGYDHWSDHYHPVEASWSSPDHRIHTNNTQLSYSDDSVYIEAINKNVDDVSSLAAHLTQTQYIQFDCSNNDAIETERVSEISLTDAVNVEPDNVGDTEWSFPTLPSSETAIQVESNVSQNSLDADRRNSLPPSLSPSSHRPNDGWFSNSFDTEWPVSLPSGVMDRNIRSNDEVNVEWLSVSEIGDMGDEAVLVYSPSSPADTIKHVNVVEPVEIVQTAECVRNIVRPRPALHRNRTVVSDMMPEYVKMSLEILKKEATKFGIRTNCSKKVLITQLEQIWQHTHSSQHVNESFSETSETSENSDGESEMGVTSVPRDTEAALTQAIKLRPALYSRVLRLEPLDFEILARVMGGDGVRCSKRELALYLDRKVGIFFFPFLIAYILFGGSGVG
ncbi:hypothetical protein HK096_002237 [Nowakowskiella sp. JEL0078]|nr:hypothetical protein HK096_002237 [Nowakowskiella sp. JEL0078]